MKGWRLQPWLAMALIFAVGMITGAALTFGFRATWMHPPGSQQLRHLWLAHLTGRLDLTADQQAKIQPILIDADRQIQDLHRNEVDRISQIMDGANAKISPLLTADQQAELKKMEEERQHDFSRHLRSWGGPRDGPGGGPPPGP